MRNFFLAAALTILRSLVYVKRAVFYVGKLFGRGAWPLLRGVGTRILFPIYFYVVRVMKRHEKVRELYIGVVSVRGRRGSVFLPLVGLAITVFMLATESKLFSGEPSRGTALLTVYASTDTYDEAYFGEIVEDAAELPTDVYTEYGGTVAGGRSILVPGAGIPAGSGGALSALPAQGQRRRVETYVVVTGDTVSAIATRFNLKQETILWENKLTARSKLRPGDVLRILPQDGVTYRVARGDTVLGIAKKFSVDAEQIKEGNRLGDAGDLIAGEILIIPHGKPLIAPVPQAQRRTALVVEPPVAVPRASDLGTQLLWPTSGRVITQYYRGRHTGLDIDGHYDSPIYASEDGVVIRSGWNNGGYGLYIVVDHGGGLQTLYAHSSKLFVNVGDSVRRGQVIAMVGTTGRSTGTHLHFEVRINGRRVNPLKYTR